MKPEKGHYPYAAVAKRRQRTKHGRHVCILVVCILQFAASWRAMIVSVLPLMVIGFLSTASGGEQPSTCSKHDQQFWAHDAAPLEPRACSMPTISAGAGGLSVSALAQRCASAGSPVLIQGLMELPEWHNMRHFAERSEMLAAFGDHEVRLSLSRFLTPGPEAASQQLSKAKLEFMRQAWTADGSAFRESLLHQIRAGEAMPRVRLGAWMQSLQDKTAPPDAYVFHNVSGTAIASAVAPL